VCGVLCCFMWFWPGLVFFCTCSFNLQCSSFCRMILTLDFVCVWNFYLFNVFENIYFKC
jgi:hypothetical protein